MQTGLGCMHSIQAFNRTIEELKFFNYINWRSQSNSFNRTIEELKYFVKNARRFHHSF